ncbi:hypothetical protein BT93_E1339 [Corymbia citriodora subsp. variegata]|nr:hypothetical protein BT93_E1339 [Corymbia citriodora subsp. variegata]
MRIPQSSPPPPPTSGPDRLRARGGDRARELTHGRARSQIKTTRRQRRRRRIGARLPRGKGLPETTVVGGGGGGDRRNRRERGEGRFDRAEGAERSGGQRRRR